MSAISDETEKLEVTKKMLHSGLPDENYALLKFLMDFLGEVSQAYADYTFGY